jgi:uncharacterized Ntn-hydrolase superfamily protein
LAGSFATPTRSIGAQCAGHAPDNTIIRFSIQGLVMQKEIETLMHTAPKSQKGELLDVLVTLVKAYERKHFPLDLPV